jgi:nickel/cobalt exporter
MDFSQLLQQGEARAWLFVPTAILLGALHGLEPGHSKTMMAAFIIAVRGTVMQAILLGLAAAISHSLLIWILAAVALRYGSQWSVETTEPYFQIVSGIMIAGLAVWMFWRTRRDQGLAAAHDHHHHHENEGPHGGKLVATGHGAIEVAVFETGMPPRFRLYFADARGKPGAMVTAETVTVETVRSDGASQVFRFAGKEEADAAFLESTSDIPEPHEFTAKVALAHGDHARTYEVPFSEGDHHHHHDHPDLANLTAGEFADAHEQEHAADIAKRFSNRTVTTPQIVWFGVTGGLMPCPAAFTILLVCLQLKRFTLGFTLVASFSLGLAITMVASGVLAAWGVRHAEKRFKGFAQFARRAPYFSAALLTILAIFFIAQGWRHLLHAAT